MNKRTGIRTYLPLVGILLFLCPPAIAQSSVRTRPTAIASDTVDGSFANRGRGMTDNHYYSLSAGPGGVDATFTMTPEVSGSSIVVAFSGRNCCGSNAYNSLLNPEPGRSHTRSIRFRVPARQVLVMRVTGGGRFNYSIRLSGAVNLAGQDDEPGFVGRQVNSTTTEVIVPGRSGGSWINTGITVKTGDVVRLRAAGEVDFGRRWGTHGPEGTRRFFVAGNYPVMSPTRYGLAAKITLGSGRRYTTTQSWSYGGARQMRVTRSGILWLTVNDNDASDNSGEYTVQVTIANR